MRDKLRCRYRIFGVLILVPTTVAMVTIGHVEVVVNNGGVLFLVAITIAILMIRGIWWVVGIKS